MDKQTAIQLDSILTYLAKPDKEFGQSDAIFNDLNIDFLLSPGLLSTLSEKGFITITHVEGESFVFIMLEDKGRSFIFTSSFDSEYEKELELLNIERYKHKLTKRKVKTFWWFFGLAIFGGLYSVYDITTKILDDNKKVKQNIVTKAQMELELSTLRTLILDQKHRDSLYNSTHILIQDYKKKK